MVEDQGYQLQPLTVDQIAAFVCWRYPQPYALYNIEVADIEAAVHYFQDPQNGYFAIVDEKRGFQGFCNFGADAQVPGGDYEQNAVDIGMGLRPDLIGQGQGKKYAQVVLAAAAAKYPGQKQRVTIAEFNQRAQRLYAGLGFKRTARFIRQKDGRPFIIMMRP